MVQSLAFIVYPVRDFNVSRPFYENVLGLQLTHQGPGQWFEYDLGDTTFALMSADADHPVPVRGAAVAFEVSDLDAEADRLRNLGVKFRGEITETPVCRFAVVLDPDGSEIILHRRKAPR